MSWVLRSTKSKVLSSSASSFSRSFSSLSHAAHHLPHNHIGSLSPLTDRFHRNTTLTPLAKENASGGNLTGLPNVRANKIGCDSNAINSLMYKASGPDTTVLSGARYGTRVCAAHNPMLSGINTVMARSFERSIEAGTLGMIGHKRCMSDVPSKRSETNTSGFRPLSPHLPLYQPQLSSTLSIFNRIAGAFLAGVILLFYMIYIKVGSVSLTYDSFYQFIFYSSKLNLLVMEISALAVTYHLYSAIRHLRL
ncbi:Succinate dehydrogenase subunit 3-1 [Vigna angularis]|uniref:Succinate dehydrogenase subunit 3-1 n=1 Tax=Phaseolus angularis TaxID=3914 RepID=A0A8T0KFT3_PHAAN|nr:succinate dehydrogenase subunit 3-1, mitochondrial [Vigna angularis]XP_017431399.1 succinate dehydrogenase subunit 3-1, mitochondrial [Vigna angularis]KAG2397323.1 Succinate dehydrogenase subunit 3-1 [Vigna angularis]